MKWRHTIVLPSVLFLLMLTGNGQAQAVIASGSGVTFEYVAHACFRLTSPAGDSILIDPYGSRIWIGYDFPEEIAADAFLLSHPHYDHDGGVSRGLEAPWPASVPVIRKPGEYSVGEFEITGIAGKHADPYGKEFGQTNTIWLIELAGLRIAHLGDNGPLSSAAAKQLGTVDILMLPADADYHILSESETGEILGQLSPRLVIPMHYRLPDLERSDDAPEGLGDIDGWLDSRPGVRRLSSNKTTVTAEALPASPEIFVFDHWPELRRPQESE